MKIGIDMSNYNWCHGPNCHTQETQSRIRGSGDNKVLRTIKISNNSRNLFGNNIFDYFCNTRCLYDYLGKHAQAISAIAPRREALETPIKVIKEKREGSIYNHRTHEYTIQPYTTKRIEVDNGNG